MRRKQEIELSVCDVCGKPFGGIVHTVASAEICGNCWTEPTPDMAEYAVKICEGLHVIGMSLKDFKTGIWVLVHHKDGSQVQQVPSIDEALATAMRLAWHGYMLIDIFKNGIKQNAKFKVEITVEKNKPVDGFSRIAWLGAFQDPEFKHKLLKLLAWSAHYRHDCLPGGWLEHLRALTQWLKDQGLEWEELT